MSTCVVHEVLEVTDRAGRVTARQRQRCRVVNLGRQTDAARQLPNVLGRVEQVRFARGERRQRQTRVV